MGNDIKSEKFTQRLRNNKDHKGKQRNGVNHRFLVTDAEACVMGYWLLVQAIIQHFVVLLDHIPKAMQKR